MSQCMLGRLPLSQVQGPRDDFEQKLAGLEGERWLTEFNKFLRKEPCWIESQERAAPTAQALDDAEAQLAAWRVLYQEMGLELGEVAIPERRAGFDRLIVVAAGLTNNQVYDWCTRKFGCWRYQDDLNSITSERNAEKAYAIWIRERVEADEENANLSANQLKKQKVVGIILIERLLYELKYFAETGMHLDRKNVTLCSGSRCADGRVPRVSWYSVDRKVCVHWCDPDYARGDLRSRAVVS